MTDVFGADLASAVRFLRTLPRRREDVGQAEERASAWSAAHPRLDAELVVDEPPGSLHVGYDLLLTYPEGGTVAISAQAGDGVPWLVDHSTHWAAGQVVSVDGIGLSVPAALYALRSLGARDRTVHEQLVDYRILLSEIADDREPVTDAELQEAMDDFRRRRGLFSRERTLRWLDEIGLPEDAFAGFMETTARMNRVRRRFTGEPAKTYLHTHAQELSRTRAAWVAGHDRAAIEEIARADSPAELLLRAQRAVQEGSGRLRFTLCSGFARELPRPLRAAQPGRVVGPAESEDGLLAGAVLHRAVPDPDDPTDLAAAAEAAYSAWLADRRAAAEIRWHWL
ncbi:TIGR04500 family putative peptide maturation system protein [Microbispora sp. NPDC046933]|uniref:TIGR04500 family putative peptide maturation system protein n=1 Tax=Microbispora sp. NPDC046933 TaxID=3155618 RepID=UPI0033CFEC11